jgi:hypothetical protein
MRNERSDESSSSSKLGGNDRSKGRGFNYLQTPICIRNILAIAIPLTACSAPSQQRAEHPDKAAHLAQAQPSSVSVRATEQPSAGPATPPEGQGNAAAESTETSEAAYAGLPTECHAQGNLCLPAPQFVDRLCRAAHVSTAIRLFAKSSPITRGYVRMREVNPVNLRGGPVSDTSLTFAEEVLILAQHGSEGEIQVSGMGGYDVLRWDGTCATLSTDELVMRVPAPPRHAPFAWNYIDGGIQEALLQNEAIRSARATQRQRCRGMSSSQSSASCREAANRLNERIVVAVRTGMELPSPEYTP